MTDESYTCDKCPHVDHEIESDMQLIELQAQLAKKRDLVTRVNASLRRALDRADAAEDRLEAVKALCASHKAQQCGWPGYLTPQRAVRVADVAAALSVAPQPEPDRAVSERLCGACYDGEHRAHQSREGCDCVRCGAPQPEPDRLAGIIAASAGLYEHPDEDPNSCRCGHGSGQHRTDEPATCEHGKTFDAVLRCPTSMQTMRSERPDVDALMRSIEDYRNAPSSTASVPASLPVEPATCEHGSTTAHYRTESMPDLSGYGENTHVVYCPGPGPE